MVDKILEIIPARGGSKRLPRKNIREFNGKPLIAYSIEEAFKCKYRGRIIVSTEDEEIANISKQYGAEIIERPKELADDETSTIDVVFHVLGKLKSENFEPDIIILIQPTSPLRNARDIENALELFLNNDKECVVSVCEAEHSPYWSFKIENGNLIPIFGGKYLKVRRQGLPRIYMPNGAIFISRSSVLRKYKSFYCQKPVPYIMPLERSIDIDNEIDFMLAELLIRKYGIE